MKFARIVERGNRQVLLCVSPALEGDGYIVVIETHYVGEQFLSLYVGNYDTIPQAYEALSQMTDDEVMLHIATIIDAVEDEQ